MRPGRSRTAVRGENNLVKTRIENSRQHGTHKACRLSGQRVLAALALSMASIATVFLLGCSASSKPGTARASTQTVVPVGVATAQRRDVPVYLKGLGSVTASNTVSAAVDGTFRRITDLLSFRHGAPVRKLFWTSRERLE